MGKRKNLLLGNSVHSVVKDQADIDIKHSRCISRPQEECIRDIPQRHNADHQKINYWEWQRKNSLPFHDSVKQNIMCKALSDTHTHLRCGADVQAHMNAELQRSNLFRHWIMKALLRQNEGPLNGAFRFPQWPTRCLHNFLSELSLSLIYRVGQSRNTILSRSSYLWPNWT